MRSPRRVLLPTLLAAAFLGAPGAAAVAYYSTCEVGPSGICREVQETTGLVFEVVFSTDEGIELIVTYGANGMTWTLVVKVCYRDPHGAWISSGDCDTTPESGDPAGVPSFAGHTAARVESILMALA